MHCSFQGRLQKKVRWIEFQWAPLILGVILCIYNFYNRSEFIWGLHPENTPKCAHSSVGIEKLNSWLQFDGYWKRVITYHWYGIPMTHLSKYQLHTIW